MLEQGLPDILIDGLSEIAQKLHDEPKNMHYLVERWLQVNYLCPSGGTYFVPYQPL
jgi:hypothetical protein